MSLIVLGVLEYSSIAMGIKALDEMVKVAPIKIIEARTMCPGKYLIVFSGDVASVEYSYKKGYEIGKEYIVDNLFLPMAHQDIIPAIGKPVKTAVKIGKRSIYRNILVIAPEKLIFKKYARGFRAVKLHGRVVGDLGSCRKVESESCQRQ